MGRQEKRAVARFARVLPAVGRGGRQPQPPSGRFAVAHPVSGRWRAPQGQGAAGVTTAIGISITKPTNATNNAYFSFNTADATAAGTYAGRLAVLVAGNLRYFHYYNA